ncbi:MAG: hypothetical protein H0W66_09995, partial [Chthoniobacterales bacterium]|nr:hypothetical protein [Chthoniobacterales bacterium]
PAAAAISATPGPVTSTPGTIVAPRAEPVDDTPASEADVTPLSTALPAASPASGEPEVRRAQPVHPDDSAPSPPPNVSATGEQR